MVKHDVVDQVFVCVNVTYSQLSDVITYDIYSYAGKTLK
jgi:hypothetical protein